MLIFSFWYFGFFFRWWRGNEKDQPEVMRLEICIKVQVRQNFGIAAKKHNGLGNFRNSICQTKHYIFTELRASAWCEAMELSTCTWPGGKGTHNIFWRWDSSLLCFPSPIKGWNEPLESTVYPGEMNALAAFQLIFLSFYSKQTIGQVGKKKKWSIDKLRLIFTKMFISSAYALPLGHYGNVRGLIGSCE